MSMPSVPAPPRPRRRGVLLTAAILLAGTVGLAIVGFNETRSEHAFVAAPVCATGNSGAGCRQLVPATVTGITVTGGKYPSYKMRLLGPASVSGTHGFPSEDGVLDDSDVGDRVTAEVWRGHVVAVRDSIFRTFTNDAPVYREREWSTSALGAGLLALALLLVFIWDVRSVPKVALVTSVRGGRGAIFFLACMAATSALIATGIELAVPDAPAVLVTGGIFVVLTVFGALLYWRGIRKLHRLATAAV